MEILRRNQTPCLIHQPRYNMLERWVEDGLLEALEEAGSGCIAYSPLAQGTLTDRYLKGIPDGSRASRAGTTIQGRYLSEENLKKVGQLNQIAADRGQSLAQMALLWILRKPQVTSVLVGASSPAQLSDSMDSLKGPEFTYQELEAIEAILGQEQRDGF